MRSAAGGKRRHDMQVRLYPFFILIGKMGELTPDLVSVPGGHASVNTPQCRGVDFINVVIMVEGINGNLRMQITCLLHSN
jgi:hypothetical protein